MPRLSSRLEHRVQDVFAEDTEPLQADKLSQLNRWILSVAVVDCKLLFSTNKRLADRGLSRLGYWACCRKVIPQHQARSSDNPNFNHRAFSSFPDTTLFDTGTQTHSFKIRLSQPIQTNSGELVREHGSLYGYASFLQRKDPTSKRGYLQHIWPHVLCPWKRHVTIWVSEYLQLVSGYGPRTYFYAISVHFPKSDAYSKPLCPRNPFCRSWWKALISCGHYGVYPLARLQITLIYFQGVFSTMRSHPRLRPFTFNIKHHRLVAQRFGTTGDIRPYFHIHDRDFPLLITKNAPRPGLIIGVTNPYFENVCKHWPHILSVGASERVPRHSTASRHSAALASQTLGPTPGYHTNHNRYISKDRALLKRLEAAIKEGPVAREYTDASIDLGLLVPNTELQMEMILRQHFAQRSQQLLAPLNRYFSNLLPKPTNYSPSPSLHAPSPAPSFNVLSPGSSVAPSPAVRPLTTSPAPPSVVLSDVRVKPFNSKDFFASLKTHGAQLPFRSASKQKEFYERWLKSPAFGAWISGRVDAAQNVLARAASNAARFQCVRSTMAKGFTLTIHPRPTNPPPQLTADAILQLEWTGAQAQDISVLSLVLSAQGARRCTSSDPCWPSPSTWSSFNSSIGGRLVAPRPPAWPCHDPHYDEAACAEARQNWADSFWRSNQTGAMQSLVWDSPQCGIDTPRNVTCPQGLVPAYAVAAESADDVSKAVEFALGRSSGAGAFGVWTHKLGGINFTDSFVAEGCSGDQGVPAVTIGAATQWFGAADEHNVTVVGGAARSVGAAGGWLQGGGHSPLGVKYGMGVDNVLQFEVVTANGKLVIANKCKNTELFWAMRGGGGGTWGIALKVTYKTHPPISMVSLGFQINATDLQSATDLAGVIVKNIPSMADSGVRGYIIWSPPFSCFGVVFQPGGSDLQTVNNTLQPAWDWTAQHPGTQVASFGNVYPTFFGYASNYINDIGIATNVWMGSRLVPRKTLESKSDQLSKFAFNDGAPLIGSIAIVVGGGAVNHPDPGSTGLNPAWRKDAIVSWSLGGTWPESASEELIEQVKKNVTKLTQDLGELANLDHASYFNEADPAEPQWKRAFFGSHYSRLLKIKQKVDPNGLFTCNRCVGSS
ncbi:FAD/FMN-containing protein [Rhizoctonia solani AG-1 IA]|uniref:FAD/FMN-containing protein n=1 Tax=Thanatephorus cucumeris (strain AG1-IA) TaxID=983506 RepID=L8WVU1_THACA|nr:FAD/FMN-containing protein [Rhizoctonia solani AG-1 IA]